MADLPPGHILAQRYEIERVLARGGTSTIYAAHTLRGAGRVAIKRLNDDADDDDRRHFHREHELLAAFPHPGLPRTLELIDEAGTLSLVEELVGGRTLRDVVERDGPQPWRRVLDMGLDLLEVLAWLHRHDIIHRDLKPENVLLCDDGAVRLIDLGAARRWRVGATRDTVPLGTPGFAAPEQYGRAQTDARTDLYSLAAVLHHALTGRDPSHDSWHFDPPSTVVADLPPATDRAIVQALSLDPAARPPSAERMAKALRGLDAEPDPPYIPATPPLLRFQRGLTPVAEVYADGLRVQMHGTWWETRWEGVERLRLTVDDRSGELVRAQISGGFRSVEVLGGWPALPHLVNEVLRRAPLYEDPVPAWAHPYVGTTVRTWSRAAQRTSPKV